MTPAPSPDTVEPTEAERALILDIDPHFMRESAARLRQHVAAEVARETAELREEVDEERRHNLYTVEESLRAAKSIAEFNGEDPKRVFASMHDRIWFLKMTEELAELRTRLKARAEGMIAVAKEFDEPPHQEDLDDLALATAHKSSPPPPAS